MPTPRLRELVASYTPAKVLASIAEEQDRIRLLLSNRSESQLSRRPPNGDWSALENVRDLLFSHGTLLREAGLESSPRANTRPRTPAVTNEAILAATKRTEGAIEAIRDRFRPVPRSRLDERPPS